MVKKLIHSELQTVMTNNANCRNIATYQHVLTVSLGNDVVTEHLHHYSILRIPSAFY